MDINMLVLGLMFAVIGLYSWRAYLHQDDPPPSHLPWVPIDVNKRRSFVSQTRDAGMYVERVRRTAILRHPSPFSFKGSTNGYLEAGLTSIGFLPPPPPPEQILIWSNGDANDEIFDELDTGGAFGMYDAIDFGGAFGNDYDV